VLVRSELGTSSILLQADSTISSGPILERGRSDAMGDWVDAVFSAGNFTGSGSMTWTLTSPDQRLLAYTRIGKTIIVRFYIIASSVGGTPATFLQITIPDGLISADHGRTLCWASDNGTPTTASVIVSPSGTTLSIGRLDGANWSAATNTTEVAGEITFEATT
jgi:hypothetical protein